MTTALLAIDESDESHLAALTATTLFGPDTTYLALHVGSTPTDAWEPVFGYPYPALPPGTLSDPDLRKSAVARARESASKQATEAGVTARPIGDVGDPATEILRVASEHGADVVVVGAHDRGWLRSLLEGSTTSDLLGRATIPILVVPPRLH